MRLKRPPLGNVPWRAWQPQNYLALCPRAKQTETLMKPLRTLFLSAVVVGASVVASAGTRHPEVTALGSLALLLPDLPCAYNCWSCNSKHSIFESGMLEPDMESAHSEFCQPGSCPAGHECEGGVTWAPFERALYTATPADVRRLAEQYPDRVRLNEERGALQVVGCNAHIVASFPVTVTD